MQQATVNLLADMGAQPYALLPGLVAATDVDRHHGADGDDHARRRRDGRPTARTVTLTGTATDAGGGVVAGVEVSTDGGTTWHPATGTTSWTYAGPPTATRRPRSRSAPPTTAATSAARRRPASPSTVDLPVLALGHQRHAARRRRRRRQRGRGRRQVQDRHVRHDHRHALLQGRRQHRHAHRHACGPPTASASAQATFTSETRLRLADRDVRQPGADHARTRPTSRPTTRPTATTRRRGLLLPRPRPARAAARSSTAPPLHAIATPATPANGVYSYGGASTFPTNPSAPATTGST